MPQLDTSTWFITILSMIASLFLLFQLKLSNHTYITMPQTKYFKSLKYHLPWENKWTKIYSPLLSHRA